MQHVCVLISKPEAHAISDNIVAAAHGTISQCGAGRWLCPHDAYEVEVHNLPSSKAATARAALVADIKKALGDCPVDVAVVPVSHRRKHLLIADMDSTMIEQECIDELADMLGLKDAVADITERAMLGEIAFDPAVRERVALLKGLPRSTVEAVARQRITLTPGGKALVATMRAAGGFTALVSGGFTVFTQYVASELGFHAHLANTLEFDDDVLAGTVREPILGRDAKRLALSRFLGERGLVPDEAMAVGDGANDLAMIAHAGTGVAFRAKPAVAAAADVDIRHGDLSALLYLQGYTREQFAA